MKINYTRPAVLLISCAILGFLFINSAGPFRIRMADYYSGSGRYPEAIRLYNKVLRKYGVKKDLEIKTLARVNYDIGSLAAGLKLKNLAIESYARGSAGYYPLDLPGYHGKADLDKDKLLAIGLLEGGRFAAAAGEFQKLKRLYPHFEDAQKYVNAANGLAHRNIKHGDAGFYFQIGSAYINEELYEEARAFFTKRILDYGADPVDVLEYLNKAYSGKGQIKSKVWGDNFFVILEDFEAVDPRLTRKPYGIEARVNSHRITDQAAYEGNYSELVDISYKQKGNDYWGKDVNISLKSEKLKLGVRVYIKSTVPSERNISFDAVYSEKTAFFIYTDSEDAGGGWRRHKAESLSEDGRSYAFGSNWKRDKMMIEKVLINTCGFSNRFYIDNIELYVL